MELRHLRAFIVVAEELHFGRAASRLFVSQAPLTRIINRLEAEIGTALFERSTRSVVLTSAGRAFLVEAQAIVECARGLLDIVTRAAHGEVGVIRLAYVTSASLVPSFNAMLHRMRERLPSVHVQLIQASTVEELENLLMDRADIAFIRPWPQDHPPPWIGWNVFAQDHLVAVLPVLPSNHRCAEGSSPLHISDLADERLIVYRASAGAGI